MEPSVIVEIISVTGTVVVFVCGYFIRSVRADIRNLGVQVNTKIDKLDEKVGSKIDKLDEKVGSKIDKLDEKVNAKIDKLDEKVNAKIDKLDEKVNAKIDKLDGKVNTLTASVAAIAATQAEHGSKLQHMMGHGERISALEGVTFGTAAT